MEQITLIGIVVTFIIGILNLLYSLKNSQTTRFINTITSSRINWIGELRLVLSEYISKIPINETNYIRLLSSKTDFFREISNKKIRLELMLNKNDELDKKIIDQVNKINEYTKEYYTVLEIYKFGELEQYQNIAVRDRFDMKINLLSMLPQKRLSKMKDVLLQKVEINVDSEDAAINNMIPIDVIKHCESEGWKVIDDVYRNSLNEIIMDITDNIDILVKMSQILLKNEWDRVKEESKKGKHINTKKN